MTTTTSVATRPDRRARLLGLLLPALLAYVPLLLTQRGQVGADTKTYLYLDPARLLSRAPYLWDEHIGSGTITHQNIGYLWPMGPWYWFFETLGFPDWVAQRLWLGTVMFAAAAGMRYLLGTIGWRDRKGEYGVLVASLAYMLSPYLLDYSARISVILLPWAGLPWLVALTARALRTRGWRYPAWFALVALTIGGINATALIMVAPAVMLWIPYAIWIERDVTGRQALATLVRMGTLTLATSLWWMAGLWAQGSFGLPVLRYTETYRTVAESSGAPEVLRGLGYWFFYGRDKLGPWIEPSVEYTNRTALLGLSYLLPFLALGAAAVVRWRHRAYFLAVTAVGVLMAVASHPWDNSSPGGALFKLFTRTDAGLALRSTPRAVPLVVLGLAVMLGAGVRAVSVRLPRQAPLVASLACLLIVVNLPPLWNGTMIANNLKRPEDVPSYWPEAAAWLDAQGASTRVLEVPGSDFASYRWGNTVDPITPGLMDRPYLARELFQYGTPASAALLIALDRPYHEDTIDPDSVAPVARLLGVGDILLRGDLQYERFRTARPQILAERYTDVPGLDDPENFGPPAPNIAGPEQPMLDEITLALDPSMGHPAPVTVYPVEDPLPIIRTRSAHQPLVLAGGPEGVVDAAGANLLQGDQALFYAASYHDDPDGLAELLAEEADLLVTDTNRRQARRWGTTQQNTGYTEQPGEEPSWWDPTDQRLEVFPGAPDAAFTTSEQRGPVTVAATDYGNPVTYTPDDRPANAVDGDPFTAWRVGAFSDVQGETLHLRFDEPVTAAEVQVVQPVVGIVNRYITDVDLVFDGTDRVPAALDLSSQELPGQTLTFDERTFTTLDIEIRDTDVGQMRRYDGFSGVGLAEVTVGNNAAGDGVVPLVQEELIHPPSQLLDTVGADSIDHRLAFLFTRLRSNPQEKVRFDEEPAIRRAFELPTERSFGVDAEARLSAQIPDEMIDELIGIPSAADGGFTATSDARIPGGVRHRASAAIDGDATTFWMPPFEEQAGHYLEVTLPEEATIDHLDLEIVADGRHSIPTRAFLRADGDDAKVREITIQDVTEQTEPNATQTVRVEFPELTGTTFRLAIDQASENQTVDWHSGFDVVLPIAIAELGLPVEGLTDAFPGPDDAFDTGCRDDLLSVDDTAVGLRVTGTVEAALDRQSLDVEPCDASGEDLTLDQGEHVLRATLGRTSGIDLDVVTLASAAGGDALAPSEWTDVEPRVAPESRVVEDGPVGATVEIDQVTEPAWLVLGESLSPGWSASIEGGPDLGQPVLIDGFANGWRLDPTDGPITVHLEWTPQRAIWIGLGLSALGVLACLLIVTLGALRSRRRSLTAAPSDETIDVAPPELGPFLPEGDPLAGRRVAVVAALAALAFSWILAPPPGLIAVPVALLTYAALRWTRGRRLLTVAAAATLAGVAAYFVVQQYRFRYPPDFAWPKEFAAVDALGVMVVLLLLLEATISATRAVRSAKARVTSRQE